MEAQGIRLPRDHFRWPCDQFRNFARIGVTGVDPWAEYVSDLHASSIQRAACLLNQQIWCWGRDIELSGRNLLLEHGFQRIEKPANSRAASIYRLELSPVKRVILRGFGIFFGDDRCGGLFLRRFEFAPQITLDSDLARPAWSADDLPQLQSAFSDSDFARCQKLLLTLIDWIREYEVWIVENVGIAYRQYTLRDWKPEGETVVPAENMAVAWRILSTEIADDPWRFISP